MTRTRRSKIYKELRSQRREFCSSGKFGFASKMDDDIAILKRNTVARDRELTRSYLCSECGYWHVTSNIRTLGGSYVSSYGKG